MSKETAGIVEYTTKSGAVQKGIVRYSDQCDTFKRVKKVLIRQVNDDMTFKVDENQKKLIDFKSIDLLKRIGFID